MPDVTMCTLPSTQSECLVVLVVTSVAMNLFLPLCCYERLLLCTVVAFFAARCRCESIPETQISEVKC